MQRELLAPRIGCALQLLADLPTDGTVGERHHLGADPVAPRSRVGHQGLSKGRQVGVSLLLEIFRHEVEAEFRVHLLRVERSRDHARRLRGEHTHQQALRLIAELVGARGVPPAPAQHEHQRREEIRVVARDGPLRRGLEILRAVLLSLRVPDGRGRGLRAAAALLEHALGDGAPELLQPGQERLVRTLHQVPPQEDLFLEAIEQGRRQSVVGVVDLGDDDDAEEPVDGALLRLGAVRDPHVPLARVLHVVLVQEVVQGLVQ
mmetsp:Transcript_2151/g.6393  ORF Transcript_2151/g.6393 Transcript_2151/m.6393 type:complete len:262 (-) Transcript_2151:23-808(-)